MANNPDIGSVTCPHCGNSARVRCSTKAKLYYLCSPTPDYKGCGLIMMGYDGGQTWLRNNTDFLPEFEHYADQVEVKKMTSKPEAVAVVAPEPDQVDQVDQVEVKKMTSKPEAVAVVAPEPDQADQATESEPKKPGFFDRPLF